MLTFSEKTMESFNRDAAWQFAARLCDWLKQNVAPASIASNTTQEWCNDTAMLARNFGITDEEAVGHFAKLRLLQGDGWLGSNPAQEILRSGRDGVLKVYQLTHLAKERIE